MSKLTQIITFAITVSSFVGLIYRQIRKVRDGIEYQLTRIAKIEKTVEEVNEQGSKPMKQVLDNQEKMLKKQDANER